MEVTIAYYIRRLNDDESASSKSRSFLQGSEEKECPYSKFNTSEMLDKLLEKELKELPKSKHPEKFKRTNDPKYCRHHRIISHPIKKCRTLKE